MTEELTAPPAEWVSAVADALMAEVHHDMRVPGARGIRIPADVGSASGLHDFTDANWYYARHIVPVPSAECTCGREEWVHDAACPVQSPVPAWWPEGFGAGILSSASTAHQDYAALLYNLVADEVNARLVSEAADIVAGTRAVGPDERLLSSPEIAAHLAGRN